MWSDEAELFVLVGPGLYHTSIQIKGKHFDRFICANKI